MCVSKSQGLTFPHKLGNSLLMLSQKYIKYGYKNYSPKIFSQSIKITAALIKIMH